MSRKMKVLAAASNLIFYFSVLYPMPCAAQTTQSPGASTNSADAPVAVVNQAIAAMGGEGWAAVSAATAQSTTLYPDNRSVTTTRSNDWSKQPALSRADRGEAGTSVQTNLETSSLRVTINGSKPALAAPANYDLDAIAQIYPAAALRLALQRNCKFKAPKASLFPEAEEEGAIAMECFDSRYPGYQAHFLWWF